MPKPDARATAVPLFEQSWPEGEYRLFQIGFMVDDLLEAAGKWVTVTGVGPFHVMPRVQATCIYRGAESGVDLQVAVAQAGPAQIELIQDFADGPNIFRERLARYGIPDRGIHQLCTVTTDFDSKKQHYRDLGYEIACEMTNPRHRVAYVDTVEDFGFYTEIVEDKASFRANLAKIAQTCATWDGVTDPIRLLTRDGYETPDSG